MTPIDLLGSSIVIIVHTAVVVWAIRRAQDAPAERRDRMYVIVFVALLVVFATLILISISW